MLPFSRSSIPADDASTTSRDPSGPAPAPRRCRLHARQPEPRAPEPASSPEACSATTPSPIPRPVPPWRQPDASSTRRFCAPWAPRIRQPPDRPGYSPSSPPPSGPNRGLPESRSKSREPSTDRRDTLRPAAGIARIRPACNADLERAPQALIARDVQGEIQLRDVLFASARSCFPSFEIAPQFHSAVGDVRSHGRLGTIQLGRHFLGRQALHIAQQQSRPLAVGQNI